MEIANCFLLILSKPILKNGQKGFKVGTAINLVKEIFALNLYYCLLIMNSLQSLKTKTCDLQMALFSSNSNLQFPN